MLSVRVVSAGADRGRALLLSLRGDGSALAELAERDAERERARLAEAAARVAAEKAEHERKAREEHARMIGELAGEREAVPLESGHVAGQVALAAAGADVSRALWALALGFELAIAGEADRLPAAWLAAEEAVTRARVALDAQPFDSRKPNEASGRELARIRTLLVQLRHEGRTLVRLACERGGVSAPPELEGLPR